MDRERGNGSGTSTALLPASSSTVFAQLSRDQTAAANKSLTGYASYEFIDSRELAARWSVPESWIRDRVRSRAEDPLPHVNFGKYVRFLWGSPDLEEWVSRRIVRKNNRRVERVR
jgi:hypothetical protein